MQGTHEPQANLGCSEQDADENEGYADDPSSVTKIWVSETGLRNGWETWVLDLHIDVGTLAIHFKSQNPQEGRQRCWTKGWVWKSACAYCGDDRVHKQEHLQDPEWRQRP